jgi:murein DD-endopeptidase MepM/ murein hydrolase activator NlpD
VKARRDEVAGGRLQLVGKRSQYASARAQKAAALSQVRGQRKQLEGSLSSLRREQARIQGTLRNSGAGFHGGGGSGRLIWPVNGPITSYFCERRSWEACHPGIDIGVPSGTPIKAADGGRVALASYTGGYGNYTCIQHTSTLSTCYGHQSSFAVSGGQRVSQGQVIGYTGCTGLCFGAHLHFEVRVNGSVVNPLDYLG